MDDIEKAIYTAQEAKTLAESAHKRIEDLHGHLATISSGIEGLRTENTAQHAANTRKLDEGFERVHARISSVKKTQDDDQRTTVMQFSDIEKTIANATKSLSEKISAVQVEAKAGDENIKHEQTKRWLSIVLAVLKYAAIIAATLVAGHYGYQLTLP